MKIDNNHSELIRILSNIFFDNFDCYSEKVSGNIVEEFPAMSAKKFLEITTQFVSEIVMKD